MGTQHHVWQVWADSLHRWGLREFAAWLLEAIAPINLVGAQIIYIGKPLLEVFIPVGHMDAFAHVLEDPQETRAFVMFLREER